MLDEILNPRRGPRVPLRCDVEIRHRLSVWNGETDDIGPGGCRVVTPRVLDPGRNVKLAIRSDALPRTLLASGRVVWMRAKAPARLGIAFEGSAAAEWFEALVRARPALARAARSAPARLPRPTRVYLGVPPELVVDFSAAELDLLRRVGSGVTVDALARSFAPEMGERTRGALFSLIERRQLVLDPATSPGPVAWLRILAAEGTAAAAARAAGARTAEAQRLYDEALAHIGSGRLSLAMDRLTAALRQSPGDAAIASTVRRIGKWA
jgi:PilZ domain-containing protein